MLTYTHTCKHNHFSFSVNGDAECSYLSGKQWFLVDVKRYCWHFCFSVWYLKMRLETSKIPKAIALVLKFFNSNMCHKHYLVSQFYPECRCLLLYPVFFFFFLSSPLTFLLKHRGKNNFIKENGNISIYLFIYESVIGLKI